MAPTMSTAYTHGHTAVTRALALAPPRRQDMPAADRAELHLWYALAVRELVLLIYD